MPRADRREGFRFGWSSVGAPMLRREVVEGHEDVSILGEAAASRLVLGTVLLQEVVEGLGRHLPGLGQPDLVKGALSRRLESPRHLVEHVGRLVNPAPLLLRRGVDLPQCGPEKDSPVNGTSATVFRLTDCS